MCRFVDMQKCSNSVRKWESEKVKQKKKIALQNF